MHISYAVGLAAVSYASQALAFPESSDLAILESAVVDVEAFCLDRDDDSAVAGLDGAAVDAACDSVLDDDSELEKREAATKKVTKKTKKAKKTKKTKKGKKTTKKAKAKAPAKKPVTTCNAKDVAAVKKAHPKDATTFCKKYKPSARSTKSPVKGVSNSKKVVAACKCILAKPASTKKTTKTAAVSATTPATTAVTAATTATTAAGGASSAVTGGAPNQGNVITTSSEVVVPATTITAGGQTITNPASTYFTTYVITLAGPVAPGSPNSVSTGAVPTVSVPVSVPGVGSIVSPAASVTGTAAAGVGGVINGGNQQIASGILDSTGGNIIPTFAVSTPTAASTLTTAIAGNPAAAQLTSINSAIASVTAPFASQATALASALSANDITRASAIAASIRSGEAQAAALVSQGNSVLSTILNSLGLGNIIGGGAPSVPVSVPTVPASVPVSVPVSVPTISASVPVSVPAPSATVSVGGVSVGGSGVGVGGL